MLVAYDDTGNWQEIPIINSPGIFADPDSGSVSGYWVSGFHDALSVRVLGQSNVVKASGSASFNKMDASFTGWLYGTWGAPTSSRPSPRELVCTVNSGQAPLT